MQGSRQLTALNMITDESTSEAWLTYCVDADLFDNIIALIVADDVLQCHHLNDDQRKTRLEWNENEKWM